jgi:NitT/TauT family transport system ATP-binding protein
MSDVLAVERVRKWFRVRGRSKLRGEAQQHITVLQDVSFGALAGELVTLLGPSGCGKTTLLKIVAGLLRPDEGAINIEGRPVEGPDKHTCMVFQTFGLLPWRTVLANVEFPLELDGRPRSERRALAHEHLARVGLRGFEEHYPHELSGGMQQRVGIARALMRKPSMLLMDEPFGALDAQTREDLQEDFLRIWSGSGTTVLFVTHSIDESLMLSDRIVVFTSRPGTVRAIIDSPVKKERLGGDVRAHPEFAECRAMIRQLLRSDR